MKTICLFLSLSFSFLFVNITSAQWVQTNGPLGGRVYCVERVGNQIWAGTRFGIFTSDNEGLSWQKSSLINDICIDIHSKNDTVFILFSMYEPDSLYEYPTYSIVSFDGGNSFNNPIWGFTPYFSFISRLRKVGNTYIINDSHNYYRLTHDFGSHWQEVPDTIQNGWGYISVMGNHLIAESSTSGSPQIYNYHISSDEGYTWQLAYSCPYGLLAGYVLDSVLIYSKSLHYAGDTALILRANNYGASWDTVFALPTGLCIGSFYKSNDTIYGHTNNIGDTSYYYFSTDRGLIWNLSPVAPYIHYNLYYGDTVNVSNGDLIQADYYDGIVRKDVSQDSIFPTNTGLGLRDIKIIRSYQGILYASEGFSSNNSLYYSKDEGQTWNKFILPNPSGYPIKDLWFNGDTILVSTSSKMLRSLNNGLSWTSVNNPNNTQYPDWEEYPYIEKLNNRLYYSCEILYYSDDLGNTWSNLPFVYTNGTSCNTQYLDTTGRIFNLNNNIFALLSHDFLFKYDSNSDIWELIKCNIDYDAFQIVDDLLVCKTWDDSLAVSQDYGLSWQNYAVNGLPIEEIFLGFIFPIKIISVNGTWFGLVKSILSDEVLGIYASIDQGRNWYPISDNDLFQTNCITLLNGALYAGSYYKSVWRRSGNFNLISGTVFRDNNQNGIQDIGELGMPNIIVRMVTANTVATTDADGYYSILTDVTGDTLKPVLPVSFSSSIPGFYITNGAASNKDLGIYLTPGIADLSIDLTSNFPFRPGFNTVLHLSVSNNGSLIQSPNIQLTLDTSLTYISSSVVPSSIIGNTIQWNTGSLDYMDVQNIEVTVVTSVTSSLGDSIQCFSFVDSILNDINVNDNYSDINEIIVGSYDPNDKTCMQGGYFTPEQAQSGKELEYVIRFQNTGTYLATNIYVSDTLNSYLDFSSFRVISSSNPMTWNINGNAVVDFNFNDINLPPISQDELNSHGFVKYAIKCKQGISLGNVITNTANIYFDFNPPIITNTATTAIAYSTLLQIDQEIKNNYPNISILVYPNPTSEKLNVNISGYNKNDLTLFIYSNSGEIIKKTTISGNLSSIDFTGLSDGLYYGFITNSLSKKVASFKFIFKSL